MGISLKPEHLKRYKDIAKLFLKYGRSDLVKSAGLEDAILQDEQSNGKSDSASAPNADELAKDLEAMGPTFIKLGQLLSSRADLLPTPYLDALARLQDDVEPFPFSEIEEVVTTELGVRLSKAFAEFDPKPVAAASQSFHRNNLSTPPPQRSPPLEYIAALPASFPTPESRAPRPITAR